MKKVTYSVSVETDWVKELASNLGGFVNGNYTIVPEEIFTGIHYVLSINDGITVLLTDVTYHQDVLYKLRNSKTDFVAIYFNLTEGEVSHIMNDASHSIGRWNYNLAIVDSQLDIDFMLNSGSKSYSISIFFKKQILRGYLAKTGILERVLNRVFDEKKNTILLYAHMSSNSWHIINEFRKNIPGSISFDLLLSATVYNLMADCLDNLTKREIMIGKIHRPDIASIITSQSNLIKNPEGIFPGIAALAADAFMSETKYKNLYKKITGYTPNAFFLNNKLELARDLLATGQYSVGELAEKLSFTSASHLSKLFKNYFGMLPREYTASLK